MAGGEPQVLDCADGGQPDLLIPYLPVPPPDGPGWPLWAPGGYMDLGIFDHLDRRDVPVADFYEHRLRLLEKYDAAGFYSYHLAEHHATPLGLAPVPGIFLAAATQRTRRIRHGPCVYCLPLYDPLRLIEEADRACTACRSTIRS